MNLEKIIQVIEAKRLACKMHKATLCSKSDISTTYYNKLLAGDSIPSITVLSALLDAVGLRLAVVGADFLFI